VHLVGFIIRIYHDARSPERQKLPHSVGDVLSVWCGARNLLWSNGDTLNTIVLLHHHPEDGRTTGRNVLVNIFWTKNTL